MLCLYCPPFFTFSWLLSRDCRHMALPAFIVCIPSCALKWMIAHIQQHLHACICTNLLEKTNTATLRAHTTIFHRLHVYKHNFFLGAFSQNWLPFLACTSRNFIETSKHTILDTAAQRAYSTTLARMYVLKRAFISSLHLYKLQTCLHFQSAFLLTFWEHHRTNNLRHCSSMCADNANCFLKNGYNTPPGNILYTVLMIYSIYFYKCFPYTNLGKHCIVAKGTSIAMSAALHRHEPSGASGASRTEGG